MKLADVKEGQKFYFADDDSVVFTVVEQRGERTLVSQPWSSGSEFFRHIQNVFASSENVVVVD